MKYLIYCDGAVSGNGRLNSKGGWAGVILDFNDFYDKQKKAKVVSGYEDNTTNQRMELTACLESLKSLPTMDFGDTIIVRTDSAYLCNCFNQKWYVNWKRNGWKNASRQPVKNQDLWEKLIVFFENYPLTIEKVKGHSDDMWNNFVDELAVSERKAI